jgi:hypothetical protein
VAQDMGRQFSTEADPISMTSNHHPCPLPTDPRSPLVEKQSIFCLGETCSTTQQSISSQSAHPLGHRCVRWPTEGDNTFSAALAKDP